MSIRIWHNPRCSKSRATLALLEEQGVTPEIIRYLETPPTAGEIREAIRLLGLESPRELMRKGETEYRENGLDNPELDADALIHAMQKHPRLIERPIVFANGKAAIGRPPENVLALLAGGW